ncbi:M28 family metallopeptidase [Azospirillum brasilense]|uniref:M28 family metallopeptidase n=1 Tax=Azospirillum brasilense TaxID=192 RepID=UPI001ED9D33A|nr:M28 family metallopeptidase [Azospirillum brasilense]UKJ74623.1 Zn-dependent exopeptidase M28 [Azospirillum brasilense]
MRLAFLTQTENDQGTARTSRAATDPRAIVFGDTIVLPLDDTEGEGADLSVAERRVAPEDLYLVVQKGRLFQHYHPDVPVLLDKGRFLLVELPAARVQAIGHSDKPCFTIDALQPGRTVYRSLGRPQARRGRSAHASAAVERLSEETFGEAIRTLTGFPTRLSTSAHFRAAADWAGERLRGLGFDVSQPGIDVSGKTSRNVQADRVGKGTARRLVLVTAHLDSVNHQGGPDSPAPGADDNASGSAGALTLASALAGMGAGHDFRILLFGGEEQGLHGSTQHVAGLPASERRRISCVINMDMIAVRNAAAPSVLLEGAPVSSGLIDALADAAALYTTLRVETSLSPFDSDHVPFIRADIPAVLTIEGADRANTSVHTAQDTPDRLDHGLAMQILQMNAAVLAEQLDAQAGT